MVIAHTLKLVRYNPYPAVEPKFTGIINGSDMLQYIFKANTCV